MSSSSATDASSAPDPPPGAPWIVEILPVFLQGGLIRWLRPQRIGSWQVAGRARSHPHEVAQDELSRLGCGPFIVHSTSWRHEAGTLVLTYLVVLPERHAPADGFDTRVTEQHDLARGATDAPPPDIAIEQVLAHALRHLAWLAQTDPAIGSTLGPGWHKALEQHQPEPFGALETS